MSKDTHIVCTQYMNERDITRPADRTSTTAVMEGRIERARTMKARPTTATAAAAAVRVSARARVGGRRANTTSTDFDDDDDDDDMLYPGNVWAT